MADKLTVLIPCKDEAHNIGDCIEAARQVADEILVADSGSQDRTMRIVEQAGGCRLIERDFVSYADFKNWAIPQAEHPWVLIVDADERVTPELAQEIRRLLDDPPTDVDGYWVFRRNFFIGREIKHCGWNTDKVCRLIRRDVARYDGRLVHEEIDLPPERTGRLEQRLIHYTVDSYDHYLAKRIAYTALSARDARQQGQRTGFGGLLFRPFLRFFHLYVFRLGFLDGLAGIQVCMLTAFFNTFVRQGRLWEMEQRPRDNGWTGS